MALPVNDTESGYDYPERVRWSLQQDDLTSYQEAAEFLNFNNLDMVCVRQGLMGGVRGAVGTHIPHPYLVGAMLDIKPHACSLR